MTSCIHPDYNSFRYIGLDTKCDPHYLGSSTVLKWWIKLLGREYFKKEILHECDGDMSYLCRVEQSYIQEHDAVSSPLYFNMNGRVKSSGIEDNILTLEYTVQPIDEHSQESLGAIVEDLRPILFLSHDKTQLSYRILSLLVYGYLKYGQTQFEYNEYTHYGSCTDQDTESVINALCTLEVINLLGGKLCITQNLLESLSDNVSYESFKCTLSQ